MRERERQRKERKLRNTKNKEDNNEQDTLPYSSYQQAFLSPFLSLFCLSILPLLNRVAFISTGTLMVPERLLRAKEERERFKSGLNDRMDGEREKAQRE